MSQTVIDYKDEAGIYVMIGVAGLFFLYIIGEPFIDLWKITITLITEHVTKIRFFVYASAIFSVLLLAFIMLLIFAKFGGFKVILFYIALQFLDLMLTKHNTLIEFSIKISSKIFNWLFGSV